MKKIIFTMLMILTSLLSINFVGADTCSFLDSDGDCVTTMTEMSDVQDLAMMSSINCYWSNCQYTLDVDGDGVISLTDVNLIRDIALLQTVNILGAPSVINLELINSNTQIKITVTDSDGTPRSDIGVNYEVVEDPLTYNGVIYTDANGEVIADIPIELQTQTFTAKAWFDADSQKQIPYTEALLTYIYTPPQQPTQTSSSGGGGGGGSSTPYCEEKHFECSEWGECIGDSNIGTQTRTCEKKIRCKGDYEPVTSTSCYNWDYVKGQQSKEEVNEPLISESIEEVKEAPKATGATITVRENIEWKAKVRNFFKGIWDWFSSLF